MDFPSYSFGGPFQGLQSEIPTYQGQPLFADLVPSDGNIDDGELLGAEVLNYSMASWSHPAMQRFLKDSHRPLLFNPMPQSQPVGFGVPVTPIPPANMHRFHESPPSSKELSSCSSARSPCADTDMFTENTPSTPPDVSFVSTFQGALFDPLDLHSQQFLSGMGGCPGDAFAGVSMADVNPADDTQNEWAESPHVIDFTSPQRNYTLDSHSSMPLELDAKTDQVRVEDPDTSPGSPEFITAARANPQTQAVSLFEATKGPYPTPSIEESETSDAEIDVASPTFEDEEDDDDEYQPKQKPKSPASLRRPNKAKRTAPSRPLDKGSPKRPKTASTVPQPARPLPTSSGRRATFSCSDCSASFKDDSLLQSHIKKMHTRPFVCVFHFAGCQSTFASKNEWKRHVMSQHLVLTYWLCDIDVCAHNKNSPSPPSKSNNSRSRSSRRTAERMMTLEPIGPPLPNGAIFNRKDLYTQHLRRMHTPPGVKKSNKTSKATVGAETSSDDWEETIKSHQSRAHRERCKLPTQMQCPANHCDLVFSGTDAWDQRMEHVAKHLEKAATGAEDPVVFGGPTDPSLMDWVTKPEVAVVRKVDAETWMLNNPLRSASEGRGVGRRREVPTTSAASGSVVGMISLPFSASMSAFVSPEDGHIVTEEEDEDAEGEVEY